MHRLAWTLTALTLCVGVTTCAKKPPVTAGPPPPSPPPKEILAEAAPEPIATPGIWFAFDLDFVRNRYRSADLAFGSFTISEEWAHSGKHGENCSSNDAEVHVGVYEDHLGLADDELPFSSPVQAERVAWGAVIEPPNVTSGEMKQLKALKAETATLTFDGYLRVWNEGHHDDEDVPEEGGSSNPNHVLELHPAWRMTPPKGAAHSYRMEAMDDFKGYGLSKLKTILSGFASKKWPTMYQDADALYVHLPRGQPFESNFYQLPVVIRTVTAKEDGIIMDADVCDKVDCSGTTFLYKALRLVTVPSTEEGAPYFVGEKAELLRIFSVNLRRALDLEADGAEERRHNLAVDLPSSRRHPHSRLPEGVEIGGSSRRLSRRVVSRLPPVRCAHLGTQWRTPQHRDGDGGS